MNDFRFIRFKNGLKSIKNSKWKTVFLLLVITIILIIYSMIMIYIEGIKNQIFRKISFYILSILTILLIVFGLIKIIKLLGTPFNSEKIQNKLINIDIKDNLGNSPILLTKIKMNQVIKLEFYSEYIPITVYMKKIDELETILNKDIIAIEYGKDKQHVIIECTKPMFKFPSIVEWNVEYLNDEDFKLSLGLSNLGFEYLDLNSYPHLLIGGETGSGKSTLYKSLLIQCLKKNAEVILFDYKFGVDYQNNWLKACKLITTIHETNNELERVMSIMHERMELLAKSGFSNIHDYNQKNDKKMNRIIIAIDEVAEIFDKSDKNKEIKAIEEMLASLGRLSRASGIHLMLATQRPSAEIIKGEIKTNLGNRICGKADSVLSKIILGENNDVGRIPKGEKGVFLTNSNVLFKSYYMSEQYIQEELEKIAKDKY